MSQLKIDLTRLASEKKSLLAVLSKTENKIHEINDLLDEIKTDIARSKIERRIAGAQG